MAETTTATPASATPETTPATTTTAAPTQFSWDSVQLSPETKQLVADRKWENIDTALTSYRNLEKLTGVPPDQIIKLPKDNDPKAWDAVYNKLGRPETADKYTIPLPEGDKGEFANVAKTWFHEAGISQSSATKLAERWNGYLAEQQKTFETQQTEKNQVDINALKQEWGADYDKRAQVVDRAAETFGMTQEQLSGLKDVLGPKAAMTFLYNIGAKIPTEEKAPVGMSTTNQAFSMTPEDAKAQLQTLRADKNFSQLFNSADPKTRMEAREKIERLSKLAYPGATMV